MRHNSSPYCHIAFLVAFVASWDEVLGQEWKFVDELGRLECGADVSNDAL